ncbi:hypothetical protein N4Q63_26610, partial [Leclercia adecarboxylata]|nr:hypothetical protein [Leclercia adecarboxylata]
RNPFLDDPIFRRFFGVPGQQPEQMQRSLGSGVMVDASGLVVTNNHVIEGADQVPAQIAALGQRGGPGMIDVLRGGERLALEITPRQGVDGRGQPTWQIGIGFPETHAPAYDAELKFGPFAAVPVALRETARMAGDSLGMMRRIVTGNASLQN